jgi:autotransporter passenger strand-loop-strand repeat protein
VDIDATVSSGGKLFVAAGGTDIGPTIRAGGSAVVSSGGVIELLSGGTTSGMTLLSGATLEAASGAIVSGNTVSKGVTVLVLSGGTADALNVKAGGLEIISAGGFESGSNVSSGGTFETIGNANVAPHLLSGAIFEVGSGAVTSVTNESGVTVSLIDIVAGATVTGGGIAKREWPSRYRKCGVRSECDLPVRRDRRTQNRRRWHLHRRCFWFWPERTPVH